MAAGKLTPKMKKFCLEYLKDLNATQAAIRAGYSKHTAKSIGVENLTKPAIKEFLDKKQQQHEEQSDVTIEWIRDRLKEVAERCMQRVPVLDSEGNETGEYRFDSPGANRALELLGKHKAMFTDKVITQEKPYYTDEELEKELRREQK